MVHIGKRPGGEPATPDKNRQQPTPPRSDPVQAQAFANAPIYNPMLRTAHAGFATTLTAQPPRSVRLAALGQSLMELFDVPLMVLDSDGAVLEANAAANRRLNDRAGLWRDLGGRLLVQQGGRWITMSRYAIEMAAGREVRLNLDPASVPGDGQAWQLVITPMVSPDDTSAGAPWMLVKLERVRQSRGDAMRSRFRFTQTQARLAEMLCQGMRPTRAAEALGVKISTVRTHVGQMYEKTGTHTQAQLVALLSSC
jgi:DNA-binding CsgD family transcriptional regulator